MVVQKRSFNVDVGEKLSDAFSAQVNDRGYTKYRAIEGALRAFMALPAELQVQLMSNDIQDVSKVLVEHLLDAETLKFLESLSPKSRQMTLEKLKEARAEVSRKK